MNKWTRGSILSFICAASGMSAMALALTGHTTIATAFIITSLITAIPVIPLMIEAVKGTKP